MKIFWEESAKEQLFEIEEYVFNEYGVKASKVFLEEIKEKIESLLNQPEKGQTSQKIKGVRKLRLTKKLVAFYKVINNTIYILDLFDQRQSPDKSKY